MTNLRSWRLLAVLLTPLLTRGAIAQGPMADERGATALAARTNARLESALDTIRAEKLRADLRFIASDELRGRDTPSPGLRRAARYIRSRLQRLGFTPAGDEGFFDLYNLAQSAIDADRTFAAIERGGRELRLAYGQDYYIDSAGVRAADVAGAVVFAGAGTAAELERVDVEGRWVLTWDDPRVLGSTVLAELERRGAVGRLVASAPNEEDAHGEHAAARAARGTAYGRLQVVSRALPTVFLGHNSLASLTGGSTSLRVGQALGGRFRDHRATFGSAEPMVLENVAGLWPGSDPELSQEVIVISAHYDHVGVSGESIYNGADDNGSGTCGMLALAEALVAYGPMKRSVLLLWVSGEEKGLLGSKAWTLEPTLPEGMRAVCNLNIDMIGRNAPDYLLITPTRQHAAYNGLTRMAERHAPLEGFPRLGSCDDYWRRSDHMNFSDQLGIPVAFLFSDVHEDYHQPGDTWDKVDFDKIRRVTRLVLRMLDALQGVDVAAL